MTQLSTSTPGTSAVGCPRCKLPLIDPHGLGWCKACGYCQSLAEGEAKTAQTPLATPAPENGLSATGSAILQTPTWFWVMLVGVLLVSLATYACGRWLSLPPFQRALFATVQIVAGFALMFLGQFIGLLRIAPEDATLSFKDAVFPFRLYGLVPKYLPATRHTVYFCVWGTAAIISATIFIGGLGHWFTYLPGNQNNPTQKIKAGR